MNLTYQKIMTPVAPLHVIANDHALVGIYFDQNFDASAFDQPLTPLQNNQRHPVLATLRRQLTEYFRGKRSSFDIPLVIAGTELQKKAWRQLARVGYGKTTSYAAQAKAMGHAKAVRAVASANGLNRFPIVVPCHRIIRSDGTLGGYAGGLEVKRRLLRHERAQRIHLDSSGLQDY